MSRRALRELLTTQYERWWNIDGKRFKSKKQFLGYAGRYARRPPIAQHRFRTINRQEIRFVTKDTRSKRTVETTYTPAEFLSTLAHHVPDRYRHNGRYFGLLAPRVKSQTHDAVFALLGQERLGKPRRLRWETSMQKCFSVDPLVDRDGQRMRWARRVPPAPTLSKAPGTPAPATHRPAVFAAQNCFAACARERLRRSPQSVSFQRFDGPLPGHGARPAHRPCFTAVGAVPDSMRLRTLTTMPDSGLSVPGYEFLNFL
jgi:hypothetical protein